MSSSLCCWRASSTAEVSKVDGQQEAAQQVRQSAGPPQ